MCFTRNFGKLLQESWFTFWESSRKPIWWRWSIKIAWYIAQDFQDKLEFALVDFTVDGYVDVNEDVLTSETHVMTDAEIIVRVTQSQYDTSDVTEENNGDEEEDVDWKMSPSRKDEYVKHLKIYGHVVSFKITERKCGKKCQR